ncbi:hypothetical protein [Agaribacter marinus]|uniref:Lipoprotein n=1 Tax=Agaribacter marinus TaxID=1431249 RepID=A0AA37WG05_9ALTE|nr:hypothetical protein [Agaribacter marinus]GLR69481.1 putative lipoprotein [Agaribacter marinus]
MFNFNPLYLAPFCLLLFACTPETSVKRAEEKPSSQFEEHPFSAVARLTDGIPAMAWIENGELYNPEALIPSQCYTKTEGKYNPCYVCHQSYDASEKRVNDLNDGFLQGTYGFSDQGRINSWVNLFTDRTGYIESLSDDVILDYIDTENYTTWTQWMDDNWTGVNPNLKGLHLGADAFDTNGLALDGSRWVAYKFKSLPSTFWPTNGSTNDVMIRLSPEFSELNGEFSESVYFANLSLVEMAIKTLDEIRVNALNEAEIGIDLDGDGVVSVSTDKMLSREHYLGDASTVPVTRSLFPVGTEFMHTVRYLGLDEGQQITQSKRMKEIRYSRKNQFMTPAKITSVNYGERKEKHYENLPAVQDYGDKGMSNRQGWTIWGFIEDQNGELRKQHFEEQFFCMGCHKSVGATVDTVFSFARKKEGADGWGYTNLRDIKDRPNIGELEGEYLTYLKRVGGGDEFRQNQEMIARWFNKDGSVKEDEIRALDSVYELITPSVERAMQLNKAYHQIVTEQSYIYGRDVNLTPATNVYRQVDFDEFPLMPEFRYVWDIRLDWQE